MRSAFRKLRHKLLLGVFKMKRLVSGWMGVRALDYPGRKILMHVDTMREYETRTASCAKEPDTVAGIEAEAPRGGVLYDVGANVGAYSLVAAANGLRVIAIEPAFQNYFQMQRNVSLNGMDGAIAVFPVALSSVTKIAEFRYLDLTTGTSRAYYNERGTFHVAGEIAASKPAMIYRFDEFLKTFSLPEPSLLKVDVDGAELDFVRGAAGALDAPSLRSVLIEIDGAEAYRDEVLGHFRDRGFVLDAAHADAARTKNFILRRP